RPKSGARAWWTSLRRSKANDAVGSDAIPLPLERLLDPTERRSVRRPVVGAVEPALDPEVGSLGGAGLDVDVVDAHGRRAEEARLFRLLWGLDPQQFDRGIVGDELAQARHQVGEARTTLEVQDLHPHGLPAYGRRSAKRALCHDRCMADDNTELARRGF